jgi:hypothetical protein
VGLIPHSKGIKEMGIQLFKDGDTHDFKGTKCTFEIFPTEQLERRLLEGWRTTPKAKRGRKTKSVKKDINITEGNNDV